MEGEALWLLPLSTQKALQHLGLSRLGILFYLLLGETGIQWTPFLFYSILWKKEKERGKVRAGREGK